MKHMNSRKWIAAMLALLLAAGAFAGALAEGTEDAVVVADLTLPAETAEPETAEAGEEEPVLLASVNGDEIWSNNEKMQKLMDDYISYYAQYGYDLSDDPSLRMAGLQWAIEDALYQQKAAELGVAAVTDEETAALTEEARANWNEIVDYYAQGFAGMTEESTDEEKAAARAEATAYIQNNFGYTEESFIQESLADSQDVQLRKNVQKAVLGEIEVTDDEVTAYFNGLVEADKAQYEGNIPMYEYYTKYNGTQSFYVPEGYRGIAHILLKVDQALLDSYTSLSAKLEEQKEAEAAAEEEKTDAAETAENTEAPAENAETAEATEAPAENAETAEASEAPAEAAEATAEPTEEPVTQEMVDAARQAILDSVKDKVEEIRTKYEAGTPIAELIAQYGTDPGMLSAQARQEYVDENSFADLYAKYGVEMLGENAEKGYAVHPESILYDPAFTEGAMKLEKIGELSDPVIGTYGVHLLHYTRDIPGGAVEMTDEIRAQMKEEALSEKETKAATAMMDEWLKNAEIIYTDEGQAIVDAAALDESESVETTEATEETLADGQ